jgi:hypothetical protein
MATISRSTGGGADRSLVGVAAAVVGATFLAVGVLGFVPGVTSNLGDIKFAGHESEAELLGLFQVSILHNVVHLLFGVIGLLAARGARTAVAFLVGGGAVYGLLAAFGAGIDHTSDANFVPMNGADNWLHLALAVGMVGVGVALGARESARSPA